MDRKFDWREEVAGPAAGRTVQEGMLARFKGSIGWVLGAGAAIYMLLAAAAGVFVR